MLYLPFTYRINIHQDSLAITKLGIFQAMWTSIWERVLYWKQFQRLCKINIQAIHDFWKKIYNTILSACHCGFVHIHLQKDSRGYFWQQKNRGRGTSRPNTALLSSELVLPLHQVGSGLILRQTTEEKFWHFIFTCVWQFFQMLTSLLDRGQLWQWKPDNALKTTRF